ncbi:DUF1707 domain-containing protein [Sphaerisporangium rubeum]|uniref:DUF1707 domain-containing protein n=1 Tax=Sphaerisporangium rubeum TaxID=321317 RepID=A0A7X0M630_9ACTN|nr:DUF1707 domain-containing protein [Sphaerisporangium rubeum]MBB6472802.1 hypothetical protein [Sphaerisporangium rubeum]
MTSRDDGLRVGDAERDAVMTALREHFAQGRLTHDELDERLGATLAARTAGELRQVLADLPVTAPSPQAHGGRPAPSRHGPFAPPPLPHGPFAAPAPPAPAHADLATWGYHLAGRPGMDHEWRRRPRPYRRHGHRPPVALFLIGALLLTGLVTGWSWPLFGLVKVLFLAWLVIAFVKFAHRHHQHPVTHRHRHPRHRHER